MQTPERQLQSLINLLSAANDAKAERIDELEAVIAGWRAAGDARDAYLREMALENAELKRENALLRRQGPRAPESRARLFVVS